MNLLPASVLIIFIFRKSFLNDIRANSFLKFALLMLIVHFPVYWLPPGGRQRYIIMLYPFIIQVLAYFFLLYFEKEKRKFRVMATIIATAIGIGALACLVPLFTVSPESLQVLIPVCLLAFIAMAALFVFQLKKPGHSVLSLLFALIVLRFVFGFAVLPVRATEGRAPENKAAAIEIAGITRGQQVCILSPTYFPMQSVYYFEKDRMEILPVCTEIRPGSFYIVEKIILENYQVYRDDVMAGIIPSKTFSEPFSGNDRVLIPEDSYNTVLNFVLQKREYLLLFPIRPRLSQTIPGQQQ
jgi:hypothetical protein